MNTHTRPPAEPQDAPLYLRTDVSPEEIFKAIGRLRKEARDEIDRLIRFLDETDRHMELEPDGTEGEDGDIDEPSLGFLEPVTLGGEFIGRSRWDSKSFDQSRHQGRSDDAERDDADDEPSLGFLERHCSVYGSGRDGTGSQDSVAICAGLSGDREDEHDGREPDVDDEPSLCGISADDRMISDQDLESDLGSFDRMMDQTKATRTVGWRVQDGEVNELESTEEGAHKVGVL